MNSISRIAKWTARIPARRLGPVGLALVLAGLSIPTVARAVNTCNGFLSVAYVSGPNFAVPGDVLRVALTLGADGIQGGTKLTVQRLRFDLDCNNNFALGLPCTDEGSIVEYEGDGTISTSCPGVVWSTGHAISATPNEVVLSATPAIDIPANTPNYCEVQFDIKVLASSSDSTPNQIEEVTGYLASQGDAMCDNALSSSSTQSSSIPLCPNCSLSSACSSDSCNQNTGECIHTPAQFSTPCPDTDGDLCTIPGCNGTIGSAGGAIVGCDQRHNTVVCPPDGNPCTDDAGCNPQTGQCAFPNTADSTPCPDTDNDPCTTSGCNGQGVCDQRHIVCVTTTTTTTTITTTSASTTTTTLCAPQPENTSQACSDMVDNDCDGLIDCADPDCFGVFPCPRAKKDPTIIQFHRAGSLDLIRGHAKLVMAPVDITAMKVSVLLSNLTGAIYSDGLPAGALTASSNGTLFRFHNLDARTNGGMYDLKIKQSKDKSSYSFNFTSYGNLSAATDPNMRLQYYIGDDADAARDGRVFITLDTPWTKTPSGWRAPKDH